MRRALFAAGFVATVLAANYVTTRYGLVHVWWGVSATAGTYFAGLAFVLRDAVQDAGGKRWVFLAIAVGAVLSFAVSSGRIALASGIAFALSETADWSVYSPLRRRGYLRAAVASNIVGAVVDTFLFLWIAGAITGDPLATGDMAYAPVGNQMFRSERIAAGVVDRLTDGGAA